MIGLAFKLCSGNLALGLLIHQMGHVRICDIRKTPYVKPETTPRPGTALFTAHVTLVDAAVSAFHVLRTHTACKTYTDGHTG